MADGVGPTQVSSTGAPPTIAIEFLYVSPMLAITPVPAGTTVNQYVVIWWATSEAVLNGPGPDKNQSNAWPYDNSTNLSSIRFIAESPGSYTMPATAWANLSSASQLFWCVSCSTHSDGSSGLGGPTHVMGIGMQPGPPAPPTDVVATPGDGQASVAWKAPPSTLHPVRSYHVIAYDGALEAVDVEVTGAPPPLQATVPALTNGKAYTFKVTATNSDGTSALSQPSAPVVPASAPNAPTGVSARVGDSQAVVSWSVPADNGGPIIAYDVTAHHGAVLGPVVHVAGPPNPPPSSVTVASLTNGTAYTFTVTATNKVGTSPPSAPSAAVTPTEGPHANAGAGRRWLADSSNRRELMQDLVLDGSGSTSINGTLTYLWEVVSGPGIQSLPWKIPPSTQSSPVILAAGTVIPTNSLGIYTFRLTVSDGSQSSSATVSHELMQTGIRVLQLDGTPFVDLSVELITVGGTKIGTAVTDCQGVIPIPAQQEMLTVTVFDWELVRLADATRSFTPTLIQGSPPDVACRIPAPPGVLVEVAARRNFYLTCLQCGQPFKVIQSPLGQPNLCPYDDYRLADLEAMVAADPGSFVTPVGGQQPRLRPNSIRSRGSYMISVVDGDIRLYWDESRFFSPTGGDYSFWGRRYGVPCSVDIIGRIRWHPARPTTIRRSWTFHQAALGSSPAYRSVSVPLGENRPLANQVLLWMTIHHTGIPAGSIDIRELQAICQGVDTTPSHSQVAEITNHVAGNLGSSNAADLTFHYYIDARGRIFEARPLGIQGEHVAKFNAGNIGIGLEGNFQHPRSVFLPFGTDYDIPTAEQLASLYDLVAVLAARFNVNSVWGHHERCGQADPRHVCTVQCPGAELKTHMIRLRASYPGPPP